MNEKLKNKLNSMTVEELEEIINSDAYTKEAVEYAKQILPSKQQEAMFDSNTTDDENYDEDKRSTIDLLKSQEEYLYHIYKISEESKKKINTIKNIAIFFLILTLISILYITCTIAELTSQLNSLGRFY